jgi:hypothetical protein
VVDVTTVLADVVKGAIPARIECVIARAVENAMVKPAALRNARSRRGSAKCRE